MTDSSLKEPQTGNAQNLSCPSVAMQHTLQLSDLLMMSVDDTERGRQNS